MIIWTNYVSYDETSPSYLRWIIPKGAMVAGDVAGALLKEGRWSFVLTANGEKKRRYNHRVIWEIFNGEIPTGMEIDHIDGNPLNNRIDNLRLASSQTNHRNSAKNSRNITGVGGVAKIEVNGYVYYSATYVDLEGNRKIRHFSVLKLGEEEAFKLACEFRKSKIAELNVQGAGYTERHGK